MSEHVDSAYGIEEIANIIRSHEPELNHREAYCSCGAPVGEWAEGWPEHIAALVLAAKGVGL